MEFDKEARKEVLRLWEELLEIAYEDGLMGPHRGSVIPEDAEMVVRLGESDEDHLMWFMSHKRMEHINVLEEDGEYDTIGILFKCDETNTDG